MRLLRYLLEKICKFRRPCSPARERLGNRVSLLKECTHVQVRVHLPGQPPSGQRTEWREKKGPGVCGTGWHMVRQELCSLLKKTSGPSNLEGNTFFMPICNLHQLMKCTRTLRTQNMVSFGQVERVLSSEHNASYFSIRDTWKVSEASQV